MGNGASAGVAWFVVRATAVGCLPVVDGGCIPDRVIDARLLRTFVAVAEELHFGRAATRLGQGTSRTSQQVRQVEELAGVALFHRSPVSLTAAGEALLDSARAAVRANEAASLAVGSVRASRGAVLRVGLLSHGAGAVTDRVLRAYHREHPGIGLSVHAVDFPDLLSSLLDGRVDVAFARPTIGDARLVEHVLRWERRFAILPVRDPRAYRPSIELAELSRERFLAPAGGTPSAYRRFLHLTEDFNGQAPATVDTQCRRAEEFLALVGAGVGVASTIESFCDFYRWPGVAYVPIAGAARAAATVVARASERRSYVADFVAIARAEAAAAA